MNCPGCGHPIQICKTEDGLTIPLETYDDMGPGEDRYIVTKFGSPGEGVPHTVTPVAAQATVPAYQDHRRECLDWDNGRGGRLRI